MIGTQRQPNEILNVLTEEWANNVNFTFMPELNRVALLRAICQVESSYGKNIGARFEPAYGYKGRYWTAAHVRELWWKHGDLAACSYGPTQILYVVAWELGYREAPCVLHSCWEHALEYTVELLNRRILARFRKGQGWVAHAVTIEDIADSYNSGTHRDLNVPEKYIEKFQDAYTKHGGDL
jgi:hypothetical protein